MSNKISEKFKPVEKTLDKMYRDYKNMNREMYFLCHLVLLDDNANMIDNAILAWGTKTSLQIKLDVLRRQISNPEHYVDKNDPVSFVRLYDSRQEYDAIGNALANLRAQHPGIRG